MKNLKVKTLIHALVSLSILFIGTAIGQNAGSVAVNAHEGTDKEKELNAISLPTEASCQQNSVQSEEPAEWNALTGDWWGVRNFFSMNGISLDADYCSDVFANVNGGLNKGTSYLDNFLVSLSLDFEKMFGWNGARIQSSVLGNHGGSPSELSAAAQGISSIEAFSTWKLFEFWFEQNLFDNKFSVLAGLYDLNSEFDVRETSSLFINPSHGMGPDFAQTGYNGPSSFPVTSISLRVKYQPSNTFYFQTAVLDGIPGDPDNPKGTHIILKEEDGLLMVSEIGFLLGEEFGGGYFKAGLGGWYYTSEFEDLILTTDSENPVMNKGNFGAYAFAEKFLIAEESDPVQGLSSFVRLGYAAGKFNQFDYYFGAGFTYKGLLGGRDNDVLGFAVAAAHNGTNFRNHTAQFGEEYATYEIIYELSYSAEILPWFTIQPDIQYVVNPSGCSGIKSAFTAGARFQVLF